MQYIGVIGSKSKCIYGKLEPWIKKSDLDIFVNRAKGIKRVSTFTTDFNKTSWKEMLLLLYVDPIFKPYKIIII